MNQFELINNDDLECRLATVQFEEIFQNAVDNSSDAVIFSKMNKYEYKNFNRKQRIDKNDFGYRLGLLMTGQKLPSYDNSHIWLLQQSIANEIAPEIRRRQLAWANLNG